MTTSQHIQSSRTHINITTCNISTCTTIICNYTTCNISSYNSTTTCSTITFNNNMEQYATTCDVITFNTTPAQSVTLRNANATHAEHAAYAAHARHAQARKARAGTQDTQHTQHITSPHHIELNRSYITINICILSYTNFPYVEGVNGAFLLHKVLTSEECNSIVDQVFCSDGASLGDANPVLWREWYAFSPPSSLPPLSLHLSLYLSYIISSFAFLPLPLGVRSCLVVTILFYHLPIFHLVLAPLLIVISVTSMSLLLSHSVILFSTSPTLSSH